MVIVASVLPSFLQFSNRFQMLFRGGGVQKDMAESFGILDLFLGL